MWMAGRFVWRSCSKGIVSMKRRLPCRPGTAIYVTQSHLVVTISKSQAVTPEHIKAKVAMNIGCREKEFSRFALPRLTAVMPWSPPGQSPPTPTMGFSSF